MFSSFFFFNDTATTEIYTLSLHDALPISLPPHGRRPRSAARGPCPPLHRRTRDRGGRHGARLPGGRTPSAAQSGGGKEETPRPRAPGPPPASPGGGGHPPPPPPPPPCAFSRPPKAPPSRTAPPA